MSIADLPDADAPEVVLAHPSKEETTTYRLSTAAEWAGRLNVDQYLERERTVENRALGKDFLTGWILTNKHLPPNKRPIYATCETFTLPAWVAYKGSCRDVVAYGVGSVYCDKKYRGKGYATKMISELKKAMQLELELKESLLKEPCAFSILWSDIGKQFYNRLGWKPYTSSHYALNPISPDNYVRLLHGVTGYDVAAVTELSRTDIEKTVCSEEALNKTKQLLINASKKASNAQVAIQPAFTVFDYHFTREEFTSAQLISEQQKPAGAPSAFPHARGASVKVGANNNLTVSVVWSLTLYTNPKEDTLYILHIQHDQPSTPAEHADVVKGIAACLIRAQMEAQQWHTHAVKLWNATPIVEEAIAKIDPTSQIVHREKDHIASLQWYGLDGMGEEAPGWWMAERFAWC
ncbi:hypothetical protein KEM56_002159 [Ascosphaera pollenicola]|nr:hypothetical protein KEM56_002159 [Ascosphaera pollenicola]